MNIYQHIKESRVFSYIVSGFTIYWLSEALAWIYSLDLNNLSASAAAVVTAVLTALVGLVKITFTFASYKAPETKE